MLRSSRPECIKVAVLDVDADWTQRVQRGLSERLGVSVEVANPSEFLRNGAVPPHVIVMSAHVDPGWKTLRRLRERWDEQELPVIVTDGFTNEDGEDSQAEAMQAGANAFFDRSIHQNDLTLLEKLVYGLAHV